MALNPVVFTEKVLQSFLRYQLRAYPFADPRLHGQMRELLSLDEARESPLLQGPFVSLSRPLSSGAAVAGSPRWRGCTKPAAATPDVIYRGHSGMPDVCVYLDGLSEHLHGDSRTAEQDREIRYWLRQQGYEVVEITVTDLDDAGAMARHFVRLAMYLGGVATRATPGLRTGAPTEDGLTPTQDPLMPLLT